MVGTRGGRASLDRRLSRLSQLGSRVGYDLRPAADRLFSFRDLADDFSVATSRVSADDSVVAQQRVLDQRASPGRERRKRHSAPSISPCRPARPAGDGPRKGAAPRVAGLRGRGDEFPGAGPAPGGDAPRRSPKAPGRSPRAPRASPVARDRDGPDAVQKLPAVERSPVLRPRALRPSPEDEARPRTASPVSPLREPPAVVDENSRRAAASPTPSPRPAAPVVRVKPKGIKKAYCSFAKRHRDKTFEDHAYFSIANDGSLYLAPHERQRLADRKSRARWIHDKNFFSNFGVASKMRLREPGGVAAHGPYHEHRDAAIRRTEDKRKHGLGGRRTWRPIADRQRVGGDGRRSSLAHFK